MHNFSFGISKMLKECPAVMTRDESRITPNIRTVSATHRTFDHVRNSALHELNGVLKKVEETSRAMRSMSTSLKVRVGADLPDCSQKLASVVFWKHATTIQLMQLLHSCIKWSIAAVD